MSTRAPATRAGHKRLKAAARLLGLSVTQGNVNKQKDARPLQFLVDIIPSNIFEALTDLKSMLQIIFFAAFFGAMLLLIPKEKADPVSALIDGLNDIFLKMVDLIMKAAPFFVFALLAGKLSEIAKF